MDTNLNQINASFENKSPEINTTVTGVLRTGEAASNYYLS